MHPFHQFIQLYTPLSDADWALVEPCLEKKQFMTGDLILAEGKICRHLYFLESGLLRFFVWKEGRDVTKYFTDIPYTFTSQKSFTTRQPAKESIEALEDSVVWQMPYEDAHRLLENPAWSTFIRKLLQEVQSYTDEILEEIQNETAENRYLKMLETEPKLVQRIPLKHLASYLGIAPQSLSRIRKKIMRPPQT